MMIVYRICILLLLLTFPCSAFARELQPEIYHEYIARYLAKFFPRQHLSQLKCDDIVSARSWSNYIASLDYEHIVFLQSDIEKLRSWETNLDEAMAEGDLTFPFKAYSIFQSRLENRCIYAQEILSKPFDFENKETFRWKRKDQQWPANEEEQNELWRKKIENELLRALIAEELNKTNKTDKANNTETPSTNGTNEVQNAAPPPTPLESLKKRYHQLMVINQDNDTDFIIQRYFTAFANAYDPHSAYLPPAAMDDFDIDMKLSLVGIGALLQAEDGAAKVERIIPGGPADRDPEKKLKAGDKIIAVGQGSSAPEDILHLPLNKIVSKIRGEKGTRVVLVVIPASDPSGSSTKTVELIRDEVKLEEQAVKSTIHNVEDNEGTKHRLAVIDIPAFYANLKARPDDEDYRSAADDVAAALDSLKTNSVTGVLLDLRNNGGGALLDAVRMTGLFIPSGPVVQIKEVDETVRILDDRDDETAYAGPLVVLVNRLSASASEILAAALKDFGRAVIIGDSSTHGKGTVQTVVNVGRDKKMGAVKITTAIFYRVTGSSTQLQGIKPDVLIPDPLDFMELGESSLPNPLGWTPIPPAEFTAQETLAPLIPKLVQLSETRRRKSPAFEAYNKMLAHLSEIYKTEEFPLDYPSRKKMAEAEKEISALQEKLLDQGEKQDKDADKQADVVLDESLKILADLVSMQGAVQVAPPLPPAMKSRSFLQKIGDWLRSIL